MGETQVPESRGNLHILRMRNTSLMERECAVCSDKKVLRAKTTYCESHGCVHEFHPDDCFKKYQLKVYRQEE
jgi:hypothetical protein